MFLAMLISSKFVARAESFNFMEQRFRKTLEKYNQLARSVEKSNTEQDSDLLARVNELIEQTASARMMETTDQEKIFLIQRKKQKIMTWLHERLREVDANETRFEPNARPVFYDGKNFYWENYGTKIKITKGALLTDTIWGIDYSLDPQTVPRSIRKRYYIEKAKRILETELDKQIALDQQGSPMTDRRTRGGYRGIVKDRELLVTGGHLAEKMVYSFLKKYSIDYDFDYDVKPANVYEDLQLKIDFIIKIKARSRGVAVEEDEKAHLIGVQFSTAKRRMGKQKRVRQAAEHARAVGFPFEDIIIVRVPLKQVIRLFADWSASKLPGGPDSLWDLEVKEKLFKQVMKDLFSAEQINAMWNQIHSTENPFESQSTSSK